MPGKTYYFGKGRVITGEQCETQFVEAIPVQSPPPPAPEPEKRSRKKQQERAVTDLIADMWMQQAQLEREWQRQLKENQRRLDDLQRQMRGRIRAALRELDE